jgi:integrase
VRSSGTIRSMGRSRSLPKPFLRGRTWWIKFYRDGQPVRESSHSSNEADAKRLLKIRMGEVESGEYRGPALRSRAVISDLLDLVIADYQIAKKRSIADLTSRVEKNIRPKLGPTRAALFGTATADRYIQARREENATDATINRELAIVRRAFSLGMRSDPPLVPRKPWIRRLDEDNARTGFIEDEQYRFLLKKLPNQLQAIFVVAYHLGIRLGTLRKLEWGQVDLGAGEIRLYKSQVKQKRAHTVPIYGDMPAWLDMQLADHNHNWPDCPYVFHWLKKPLGAHLKGWKEACKDAGLPDLKFHDLRRSAVRNMERAGIPRNVAMGITGHRTESVYRRYDIVSDRDLKQAATKLENYIGEQRTENANGHKTGTIAGESWFPVALPDCKLLNQMVSRAGLEPATTALKVRCSTN